MDLPSLLFCILLEVLAIKYRSTQSGVPIMRMFILIVLIEATAHWSSSSQEDPQERIVGGHAPVPFSINYIVSIQTTHHQHFCGGSLINKYWVITAAHCDIGIHRMMVVAGEYSLSIYEGTEQKFVPQLLVPHPKFNSLTNNNDLMLIKLKTPAYLNRYVSIALLPRHEASISEGRMCRVSGWGYTSPTIGLIPSTLRTVRIPIVSPAKCNSSQSLDGRITENMICAGFSTGGKDACQGDSGGPLVCDGRIYGLVSWGRGCADARFPGVYTAVSKYRRWIDDVIFSYYSKCDNF